MNLTRLQTFVEVARRGTFAAAADALSFTPSAVSQQMTKLEARDGRARSSLRETTGVRLTEAGRLLHEHAVGIVDGGPRGAGGARRRSQAEQVKRLRIGACPIAACRGRCRARCACCGGGCRRPSCCSRRGRPAPSGRRCATGRLEVGVWVTTAGGDAGPAGRETVLRREPLRVALATDHPLAPARAARRRGAGGHARGSAAAPRMAGRAARARCSRSWRRPRGTRSCRPRRPSRCRPGVALRPLAGAPEWELRAARPANEVLSVGTLAALDALRARGRRVHPGGAGRLVG